jgi:16S rRNA (guanine1207-N2)-methyltransferase
VSGPSRPVADADDPALDQGVIVAGPLGEWNGWQAVRRNGGTALLPWRSDWLAARAAGVEAIPGTWLAHGSITQALVRVQKGRAATWEDLMHAWMALAEDGRLLVTGGNDVGIATWAKRLAILHGQPGEVLANHSRARVVLFRRQGMPRDGWPGGPCSVPLWPPVRGEPPPPLIEVPQGVFSHGGLDEGTALLVTHLAQEEPAQRVLDLGCGAGHLGLNALLRWPQCHAWFVDADARACVAVNERLSGFRLRERASETWWDVSEPLPASDFDLILCNPPCHAGTVPDLTTARAMFRVAVGALAPRGRLLVVANRQLPYEADLAVLGRLETLVQRGGFKLLALTRA